ncbi:hypothetical protein LPB140_06580 [Sphingorhabdus lutea]|uniref:DUF6456 domain-containing protein n=2 Tax=Sphingorhabdus lutea TaxID=1913578 RepID=A0A1L3JF29_9SPHN|nr:hypothetical protein LPB140_06580 [Sphingorhabdus lutea]
MDRKMVDKDIKENIGISGRVRKRTVSVNLHESPLGWLHSHGHINDAQLLAGEKLRRDFEMAGLSPNVTMNWDGLSVRHGKNGAAQSPISHVAIDAKARFLLAMKEMGSDLYDICWRVICAGEKINLAERQLGWPNRSGKLVLRIALDRLVRHYKISL